MPFAAGSNAASSSRSSQSATTSACSDPFPPTDSTPKIHSSIEPTTPKAEYSDSYSEDDTEVNTPSSVSTFSSSARRHRPERPPLLALTHGVRDLFAKVDEVFGWLVEPQPVRQAVPAPPRPERRVDWRGAAIERGGTLNWKEIGDLRTALSQNAQSQQSIGSALASKDFEAQTQAQQGEAALRKKQEQLAQLRAQIDEAPAARAERLAALQEDVRAAREARDAARNQVEQAREAVAAQERAAWDAAEESAAALAAEAARQTSAAEAAEVAALEARARQAERLARLEAVMEEAALVPGARSRNAAAALKREELIERRIAVPRHRPESAARLRQRLRTLQEGTTFLRRTVDGNLDGEVRLRLSDDRGTRHVVLLDAGGGGEEEPLPLDACVRLCVGPAEAPNLPWGGRSLIEALGEPLPPAPPAGREHLCLTLFFRRAERGPRRSATAAGYLAAGATEARAIHLVAPSTTELEAWYMGVQALGAVWPVERIDEATLRWRIVRLQLVGSHGVAARTRLQALAMQDEPARMPRARG